MQKTKKQKKIAFNNKKMIRVKTFFTKAKMSGLWVFGVNCDNFVIIRNNLSWNICYLIWVLCQKWFKPANPDLAKRSHVDITPHNA